VGRKTGTGARGFTHPPFSRFSGLPNNGKVFLAPFLAYARSPEAAKKILKIPA
jgi:hypothetical protein